MTAQDNGDVVHAYRRGLVPPEQPERLIRRCAAMFCGCFAVVWLGLCGAYVLLRLVPGVPPVRFPPVFIHIPAYWDLFPFQYIAALSASHAGLATIWGLLRGDRTGWSRTRDLAGVILLTVLVSSIVGGLLWSYHDMQAGFFPPLSRMLTHLLWGAEEGLYWGAGIMAVSFPLNFVGLVLCYTAADRFARRCFPPNDRVISAPRRR